MDPIRADLISYPWNARILDATGRARYCRLLISRQNLRKYPATLPRPLARRVLWRLQLAILVPLNLPVLVLTGIWVALGTSMMLSNPPGRQMSSFRIDFAIYAAILIPAAAILFTIGWAPMRRTYRRAHTAALPEARRCPWCLYDLESVPPNIHALTTCPECGGVWRLRSVRATPGDSQ